VAYKLKKEANARETKDHHAGVEWVRELICKELVPIMRVNGLERQAVNLDGQKGQLAAPSRNAKKDRRDRTGRSCKWARTCAPILRRNFVRFQGKLADLSERRVAAEDLLKRVELRAPSSGYVHQLAMHTVGGVVSQPSRRMLIVPTKEELVLEQGCCHRTRDQLHPGQKAVVRVNSSHQRSTPELNGTLTRISADVSKEAGSAVLFYTSRSPLRRKRFARLRDLNITTGMQAEVFHRSRHAIAARLPAETSHRSGITSIQRAQPDALMLKTASE